MGMDNIFMHDAVPTWSGFCIKVVSQFTWQLEK